MILFLTQATYSEWIRSIEVNVISPAKPKLFKFGAVYEPWVWKLCGLIFAVIYCVGLEMLDKDEL